MSDPVDYQTLFNIAITLIAFLGGWIMKVFRDESQEVKSRVDKHVDAQREHERSVSDTYLRKDDFHSYMQPIRDQLNRIETAVSQKVDRRD